MLAVLMSMKPEWWEKILAGDKVLEIRKTHPQSKNHADLEWPLTVLVYVAAPERCRVNFSALATRKPISCRTWKSCLAYRWQT